jgi:hypothetical protein
MVPWLFFLAGTLAPATRAVHWPAAWTGLDSLEALGLLATGVALIRRCSWLCLPAAITATLLIVDAWFDITTSASGSAVTAAVAMAIFPELPTAVLCAVLAVRTAPCSAPRVNRADGLVRGAGTVPVSSHKDLSGAAKTMPGPACDCLRTSGRIPVYLRLARGVARRAGNNRHLRGGRQTSHWAPRSGGRPIRPGASR